MITRTGGICIALVVCFMGCIYVGSSLSGEAMSQNGELAVYYAVDGCLSNADSFTITGRGRYGERPLCLAFGLNFH